MNESLAARQDALQRQNQELNQQVEAIESRRQQQLTAASRPSSSSSTTSLRGTRSASPQVGSPVRRTSARHTNDDVDQQSEAKASLEIELSASIDSLGSQDLTEARRQLIKSESKEKVGSRSNSARRTQRRKLQTGGEVSPQEAPRSKKKSGSVGGSPDPAGLAGEGSPEGLGLEATIRYQKARLRVLQDEADAATAQAEKLVRSQRCVFHSMARV
jgi:hypothetical protein